MSNFWSDQAAREKLTAEYQEALDTTAPGSVERGKALLEMSGDPVQLEAGMRLAGFLKEGDNFHQAIAKIHEETDPKALGMSKIEEAISDAIYADVENEQGFYDIRPEILESIDTPVEREALQTFMKLEEFEPQEIEKVYKAYPAARPQNVAPEPPPAVPEPPPAAPEPPPAAPEPPHESEINVAKVEPLPVEVAPVEPEPLPVEVAPVEVSVPIEHDLVAKTVPNVIEDPDFEGKALSLDTTKAPQGFTAKLSDSGAKPNEIQQIMLTSQGGSDGAAVSSFDFSSLRGMSGAMDAFIDLIELFLGEGDSQKIAGNGVAMEQASVPQPEVCATPAQPQPAIDPAVQNDGMSTPGMTFT